MPQLPVISADHLFEPSAGFAINRVAVDGTWRYGEHRHRGFCEFMFLVSGSLVQRIDGVDVPTAAGELVLIREPERHALRGRDPSFYNVNVTHADLAICFAPLGLDSAALLAGDQRCWQVPRERRPALAELCARLFAHQSEAYGHRLLQLFLTQIAVDVILAAEAGPPRSELPPWLGQLLELIADRIEDGIAVGDLPEAADRSSEHIARSFRRHLGCTPSTWINRQRLRRAALLLAHSNREVTAIGLDLGFGSASYFSRLFRAEYGCPPGEYRRNRGGGMT